MPGFVHFCIKITISNHSISINFLKYSLLLSIFPKEVTANIQIHKAFFVSRNVNVKNTFLSLRVRQLQYLTSVFEFLEALRLVHVY